jgi:hypothetical protein
VGILHTAPKLFCAVSNDLMQETFPRLRAWAATERSIVTTNSISSSSRLSQTATNSAGEDLPAAFPAHLSLDLLITAKSHYLLEYRREVPVESVQGTM